MYGIHRGKNLKEQGNHRGKMIEMAAFQTQLEYYGCTHTAGATPRHRTSLWWEELIINWVAMATHTMS